MNAERSSVLLKGLIIIQQSLNIVVVVLQTIKRHSPMLLVVSTAFNQISSRISFVFVGFRLPSSDSLFLLSLLLIKDWPFVSQIGLMIFSILFGVWRSLKCWIFCWAFDVVSSSMRAFEKHLLQVVFIFDVLFEELFLFTFVVVALNIRFLSDIDLVTLSWLCTVQTEIEGNIFTSMQLYEVPFSPLSSDT